MSKDKQDNTITLDTPIKSGDSVIKSVTLRTPTAGELRGVKLMDIAQLDVAAYAELLPRITTPALTKAQIHAMSLPDIMQFMGKVGAMFEGKQSQEA